MGLIYVEINGRPVRVRDGITILEASTDNKYARRQYDIEIPTIGYLKGIQDVDDSGLCVVEVEGIDGLVNASIQKVSDGMKIMTKTPAVVAAQKEVLARILESHDLDCKNCHRTGNCELQVIQRRLGMTKDPSEARIKTQALEEGGIIVRDAGKCVKCGRCVAACGNIQGVKAIEMTQNGVVPVGAASLAETKCVNCGQCIAVCPVGALSERDDVAAVLAAIEDPSKFVVVQTAPSVRAGVGEYFGYPMGSEVEGKMAAALRLLGFDKVFDTVFGADLTVMEEATEFLERIENGGPLPLITSCCPAWVKYAEHELPALLPNISSCKSPQQMFGAVTKSFLAQRLGVAKEDVIVVSAMPCTAKKFELARNGQNAAGVPDVDYSLTARELGRMIEQAGIPFMALPNEKFDSPLGIGTGAGVIFGATGGVMEAALRTAADWMTGNDLATLDFVDVRGVNGVKEALYVIGGKDVKVAVVSGLANAKALMDKVASGEADYAFIEVMACPGGCVNGGGQPQQLARSRSIIDMRQERAEVLYALDAGASLRKSHDNPEVNELYAAYLGEPGSEKAHLVLHTSYENR